MEQFLIKNDSISKYNSDDMTVCPCQRMRTKGGKIVNLNKHLELLSFTYEVLYGQSCPLTAAEVENACTTLLQKGGYSSSAIQILELQYDQNSNLTLRVLETSPYKDFALRAVRPDAYPFAINCFEATLQTTASTSLTELLRHLARHYSCDIPLCINNEGIVWSIDGASPIMVKGKKITINATIHTAEVEMISETLANLLQYEVTLEDIHIEQVAEADELFYVDSRGITSVRSLNEHRYSDIVANALYRSLNFTV